jgi:hypothetical protein
MMISELGSDKNVFSGNHPSADTVVHSFPNSVLISVVKGSINMPIKYSFIKGVVGHYW